jgi:hypothetical protein
MVRVAIAFLVLMLLSSAALAEKRIAFVVGIDKYDNLGPQQQLQRAVNDARAVGAANRRRREAVRGGGAAVSCGRPTSSCWS